jgi:hypothetical protein
LYKCIKIIIYYIFVRETISSNPISNIGRKRSSMIKETINGFKTMYEDSKRVGKEKEFVASIAVPTVIGMAGIIGCVIFDRKYR